MHVYNNIDQIIHQLSQVLAKINRTFVSKKQDDSHTNLYFDPISHRIYGRWIVMQNERIIIALNLKEFSLEWLNDKRIVIESISIDGLTYSEIEDQVEKSLEKVGLSSSGFGDELHFKIPDYSFIELPFKRFMDEDRKVWEENRGLANEACSALLGLLQVEGEVRIWPHHFDTGLYVEPNETIGISFGLAMKDEMVNHPYYYLTGYKLNGVEIDYSKEPKLKSGEWKVDGNWKGVILSLENMQNDSAALKLFLREGSEWFLKS